MAENISASWLPLALAVLSYFTLVSSNEPRVVCYYTNWSVYRPGTARFNPQNINPYLCTHLVYAFGGFTKDNAFKPFDKYQDIEKGGYAKFTGLKTYNKNLKTLLAIGGWNEGSSRFSPMVASRERRKEFVLNAIKFLRQNRFDGLDLDWEYPAFRDGGKPKDRENYAKLVKELREEFEKESQKSGKPRLLLTMAVPAGIEYIQKGFDVKTLNKYLDWMNLLTYDYHSAFEPAVNHHAPLYPIEEQNEYSVDNELNIDYTIKFYLESGADRDKLVLGIPTYGRSYTLFNADATELGSPADGPGEQGDATREKGYLAYYEICEALKPKIKKRSTSDDDEESEEESEEVEDLPWTVVSPNPNAMGPFAFRGNQWVGYDDVDIVKKKAEYVADNGLGGIMFWSIDNDDFRGNCHGKPYPLIEAAKEAYINKIGSTDNVVVTESPKAVVSHGNRRRNRPRPSTAKPAAATKPQSYQKNKASVTSTTPSWTNTPEPPTTPDPGSDFKCTDEGFFPHPRDCKKYFWCLDSGPSNLGIVAHQFTCPSGLFFNKAADSCDFARNVLCKKPAATTKAPVTKAPATTTTTEAATTTRKAIKLSTKSSLQFRSTTTTNPEPELEEEYEDEDDDTTDVDAEDPRVIKELIDLIKKVGGVEQLEKQLHLTETGAGDGTTTHSPYHKKLYQKVLERSRATNKFAGNSISESSTQNSRRGPQNEGIETSKESQNRYLKKDRPQYKTIVRNRGSSTTEEPLISEGSEIEDETPQEPIRGRASEVEHKVGTTTKPLQYVNIRRARPNSVGTTDTADDTASRNALFERADPVTVSESASSSNLEVANSKRENIPEYVTIRRQRPSTTEEPSTEQSSDESEEEDDEASLETVEKEISSPPSQPQYSSIVRSRSTTLEPEEPSSPEPTTVLAVQITSLLNSPSPVYTHSTTEIPETTEIESTEPVTRTTSTTTTKTTSAPSTTSRRTIARRRGSTTTTTSSPVSSTTQVSPRDYTFRRRRPVARPNEIVSDSEETNSRLVRSTTPNSREVDGVKVAQGRRFRSRVPTQNKNDIKNSTEDSVPAAATPLSRGQFRPRLNRDELVSLTPVDVEPADVPRFVPKQSANRLERRYRGRTSNTPETVADSEVSAATVEAKRQNILPRGRSRFVVTSTVQASQDGVKTTEANSQRKPAFTRFTPRPFSKSFANADSDAALLDKVEEDTATSRVPSRLPFGRARPTQSIFKSNQGRKLPFPLVQQSTAQVTLPDDDDIIVDKNEDITLSESSIEEKEHDDVLNEEPIDIPKRRVIVKKLRPTFSTEYPPQELVPEVSALSDEPQKRKLKIIRRRPSSSTAADEFPSSPGTEAPSSTPQRVRKIIRKKIKPTESEIELTSQNVFSSAVSNTPTEPAFNYGEKTKPTIILSSVNPSAESFTEGSVDLDKIPEQQHQNINNEESGKGEIEEKLLETKAEDPPEVVVENIQSALELSEINKQTTIAQILEELEQELPVTTIKSTTQEVSSTRGRLSYKPPKRLFTPSTESSSPSSRTYSRKFNAGTYTSPTSADRTTESIKPITRRPLFSSRQQFTRRPSTTKTTPKIIDEDEEEYEEAVEEEPESQFVIVPPSQFFTRSPNKPVAPDDNDDKNDENLEDEDEQRVSPKRPYQPRIVNSNTFRASSSATDIPKRLLSSQNRTSLYPNRFARPSNDTKKRVQNVPVGYNSALEQEENQDKIEQEESPPEEHQEVTTEEENVTNASTTIEDEGEYLTMTENTYATETDTTRSSDDISSTNSMDLATATEEMEIDDSGDDYLEFTEDTTQNPTTNSETTGTTNTETDIEIDTETDSDVRTTLGLPIRTTTRLTTKYMPRTATTTRATTTTTTTPIPPVSPIVKTRLDRLFSVSRVVEVSSKLDKHRLTKNNQSRLIEEGKVMQEKKPTVDKIGEVSRFSLIKIVEDDIPIYLTRLGHVYPVENPPDNLIRIDEARNARALQNFVEGPRDNLLASESINESYKHVNKMSSDSQEEDKDEIIRLPNDDFLSYINEEKQTEHPYTLPYYQPDPSQWQFIPAAYENERVKVNKAAKSFEIVTPRNMLTDPSTLALEGLFKTEMPVTAKKADEDSNRPFLVYSSSVPVAKDVVKVVVKAGEPRIIKTYVKGQELETLVEDFTEPESTEQATAPATTFADILTTSPLVEMLTNPTTMSTTEYTTTDVPTTTETIPEETTTVKLSPLDVKRAKFGFPRRPIKPANITRPSSLANLRAAPIPRTTRRPNTTTSETTKKSDKSSFSSAKSRYSANRVQNVPADLKTKKPLNFKSSTRSHTTELPRTTTDRKVNIKPIRPNFRPAFIPRKSTTPRDSET